MRIVLKRYAGDFLALLSLATLIVIFFFRLFWLEPQLIVTPDFGRSDSWHFSLATKLSLSESLKRSELPLWEPRMGMGFPLFAEGQVGALFLPNLLLFKFIENPLIAYNVSYVIIFLTLGWGMYAWLRVTGCTKLASLFGAITIVFSGQTIPRLPHHTLLESLSLTPLVLAIAHMVLTRKNPFWISIFALVLSQQLFTGSPQPVLLTLVVLGLYTVVMFWRTPARQVWQPLSHLAIGCILGAGLGAIQLLPSAEMLRESTSPGGFSPEEASYYSFPLVHLKTLVAPFILGNPKLGTYPPFTTFDGSIFWENNLFIGWLPLLLLLLSFARYFLAKLNSRIVTFCMIALFTSFLLMLGHNSPVYLLYSVWPLSLFRVPSRFAWIFVLALITMTSSALSAMLSAGADYVNNHHNKSKAITLLGMHVHSEYSKIVASLFSLGVLMALGIHTYHLMNTWRNYHAIEPANRWLTASAFIEELRRSPGPIRTVGSELVHNKQFLKEGWNGNLDHYQFLTNIPAPNSNLYWNISQTDVYAGRFLKRPSLVESLLGAEIKASESVATISAQGKRLLDVYHASIIVTAIPLDMEQSLPVVGATASGDLTITAYRNPEALPRAYLATQPIVAPTLSKATESLKNPPFIPGRSVLVHDQSLLRQPLGSGDSSGGGTVEITSENPTRVSMRADVTAAQAILVFSDTYYPGWQVNIDGQFTNIFPVNIKERGIFIPKGSHEVVWQYRSKSLTFGAWISAMSTILTLLLLFFFRRHVSVK